MLINVKNLALEPIDFDFQEEIAIPRSGGDVPCKVKVTVLCSVLTETTLWKARLLPF